LRLRKMRTRRRRKRRKRRGFVKKEAFIFLILSIPPCSRIRRNYCNTINPFAKKKEIC
jgi:hypothetical protein